MLRLSIIAPADLTSRIVDALEDDEAVSALLVQRGAAVKPPGDLITCDLAREGANEVIDFLREWRVHERGTVHIEHSSTWMSRAGFEAERRTPGSSADAVVWADVTQRAYDESEFNWTYVSFMTLATLIASVAIVLDSQVLIIGAMVLGPEFVPVAAIGLSVVRRRWNLLQQAVSTLFGGFLVAIVLTALITLLGRSWGWITAEDLVVRPDTAFVYTPDRWSFVVAVIAGAAGVLSLTSAKVGGLAGVFISVTTVPAAGNIALGIAFGLPGEIWGSTQQLLLNIAGMAIAGWVTLTVQQVVWHPLSVRRARFIARRGRADRPVD